ncbi:MAG TPA: protein kinase [Patescibacteria group bacterium]|nr:protein kinase [Patescibacteria group bacterium]
MKNRSFSPDSPPPGVPEETKEEHETLRDERLVFFKEAVLEEDVRKRVEADIAKIAADPGRFIDKGGAGAVYNSAAGICIKVLEPREMSPNAHLMDIGNPVEVEASIQRMLTEVVDGARAPWCYAFMKGRLASEKSVIVMEQLDAVNLQMVMNGTQELPEGFDPDDFLMALSSYIDYMHDDAGVVHLDLAPRNVMVDRKTGTPRIIDFGRSRLTDKMSEGGRESAMRADSKAYEDIEDKLYNLTDNE